MKRLLSVMLMCGFLAPVVADEFTQDDVDRWQQQFDLVAAEGRTLWTSADLGSNGVACAQCHPNATNTHPETYPKFQKQLGRVAHEFQEEVAEAGVIIALVLVGGETDAGIEVPADDEDSLLRLAHRLGDDVIILRGVDQDGRFGRALDPPHIVADRDDGEGIFAHIMA